MESMGILYERHVYINPPSVPPLLETRRADKTSPTSSFSVSFLLVEQMAGLWPKGWVDSQGLKKALVQANKLRRVKAKEVST